MILDKNNDLLVIIDMINGFIYEGNMASENAIAIIPDTKKLVEQSLKDRVEVGEEVDVLIYRLYVFDDKETYLLENKEMQEGDVFYI